MFQLDYNCERVAVRNRDSRYISLLGYARGSTLGLAGWFGNIGRHAVSEKRGNTAYFELRCTLTCVRRSHLHMLHRYAYAVMLGSSPIIAPEVWL
jgi:hypothetical protein